MRIDHLIRTIEDLSNDELLERIREIRHNRTVVRPGSIAPRERAEKKVVRKKVGGIEKLLAGMSEQERASLIEQLTSGEQNGNS